MCGIVGFVGRIHGKEEQAFKTMLKLDTLRGEDSTGIVSVSSTGYARVVKDAGLPWSLIESDKFKTAVDRQISYALIGHNRAATKGAVTAANAHPFEFDNVVGVHNGTLRGQSLLDDFKNFEVDSENIYHHMSNNGPEHTVKRLNGAFALAYYHKKERYVGLVRNSERPLWYCFCNDGDTVAFASEPWIIHVALTRSGIKFSEIKEVKEGKLYKFTVPENSKYGFDEKWSETDVDFYKWEDFYKTTYTGGGYTGTYHGSNRDDDEGNRFEKKNGFVVSKTYLGKNIMFTADKFIKSGRDSYIRAYTEDVHDVEIRIMCHKGSPLYKRIWNSQTYFTAKCRATGWHNDRPYLLIDHETLEDITTEAFEQALEQRENLKTIRFRDFTGKEITSVEWLEKTSKGCFCCSDVPISHDAASIEWLDKEDFLCKNCVGTQGGEYAIAIFAQQNAGN